MLSIITTIEHTDKGATKMVARAYVDGKRKQKTSTYDHSVSHERNHGSVAGDLALALGLSDSPEIQVHSLTEGGKFRFLIPA